MVSQAFRILVTIGITIHVNMPTMSVAVMSNLNGAGKSFSNQPVA